MINDEDMNGQPKAIINAFAISTDKVFWFFDKYLHLVWASSNTETILRTQRNSLMGLKYQRFFEEGIRHRIIDNERRRESNAYIEVFNFKGASYKFKAIPLPEDPDSEINGVVAVISKVSKRTQETQDTLDRILQSFNKDEPS